MTESGLHVHCGGLVDKSSEPVGLTTAILINVPVYMVQWPWCYLLLIMMAVVCMLTTLQFLRNFCVTIFFWKCTCPGVPQYQEAGLGWCLWRLAPPPSYTVGDSVRPSCSGGTTAEYSGNVSCLT